jgi:nucleoside phosphorylase
LIAGVTVVILVLIAGAVVAALTLGPRILSREAVERDVAAQFEELHGVPIEIECPDDMVLESGAEFTCTGITDEGEEVELVIAVTDPPGDAEYTWTET